jgi:hypothetical protein
MSEQHPPVPDPSQPHQPDPSQPHQPDPSQPPQADPAATAHLPVAPAAPAPPEWSGAAPARTRSGPGGWWRQATSTGGGRAALVVAGVLGVLFLVAGIGLAAALVVGHHRYEGRGYVTSSRGDDEMMGPGNGMGRGNGYGRGQGQGQGNGKGNGNKNWNPPGPQQGPGQANPANPANPGNGMGLGMGRGMAGLGGAVLHGEFTTDVTGTPAVMVVQTGEVTAYTAGKSLTVKSADGFEATYTLDAAAPATGRTGAQLTTGAQVRVLAAKDGMKVVWLGAVG